MDGTQDQDKTREQLISELADLRRRVTSLEASVTAQEQAAETLRWAEAEWHSLIEWHTDEGTTCRILFASEALREPLQDND